MPELFYSHPIVLVSFELCPYAQRVAITLAEKRVEFARLYVDLANKPEWFEAISPLGKVPLLKVGADTLFESAPIVEYLDEVFSSSLHPLGPLAKAQHRAWMEFGSSMLADIWVIETTTDDEAFAAKLAKLRAKLARLEEVVAATPYFSGETFHLVDVVFGPIFRYFDVFDAHAPLGLFRELPKLAAWRAALAARPSIRGAVVADYAERLHAFVMRKQGVLARRMLAQLTPGIEG